LHLQILIFDMAPNKNEPPKQDAPAGKVPVTMSTLLSKAGPLTKAGCPAPIVSMASASGALGSAAGAAPAVGGAGAVAGEPVKRTMLMMGTTVTGGQTAKGKGKGIGKGSAAELKVHRAMLLQIDARLRRREALALAGTAPEEFGPILASLEALEKYLAEAKASPHNHGNGTTDPHLMLAFCANLFTAQAWAINDLGFQTRLVSLYLFTHDIMVRSSEENADYVMSFHAAFIPATGNRRAKTLATWDIEGTLQLLPQQQYNEARAAITQYENDGNKDPLVQHKQRVYAFHDNIPCAPDPTGRSAPLGRIMLTIAAALGATKSHGPPPRGSLARKLLDKSKGQLKVEDADDDEF